jgi:hypothetical protein
MASVGLKHWKNFQANDLNPLLYEALIKRMIPDKLSPKQRYRTTEAGKKVFSHGGGS